MLLNREELFFVSDGFLRYTSVPRDLLKAANLRADNPEYGPASIRLLDFPSKALCDFGLDMRASLEALSVLDAYTVGFVASESNANSSSPRQTQFSHAVLGTGKYP